MSSPGSNPPGSQRGGGRGPPARTPARRPRATPPQQPPALPQLGVAAAPIHNAPSTVMEDLHLTEDESKAVAKDENHNETSDVPRHDTSVVADVVDTATVMTVPENSTTSSRSRPGSSKQPREHVDETPAAVSVGSKPGTSGSRRGAVVNRLRVPETRDLNSTSSSDEGGDRPTSADSSIAVDCPAGPTEVIVQGRNVRKIRVKFPQHKVSGSSSSQRPGSGHWQPRPPTVTRSTSEVAPSTDPLSLTHHDHTATSLPDIRPPTSGSGVSSWKLAEQMIPEESYSRESSAVGSAGRSRSLQTLQYDLANLTQYGSTDMDATYKHSVISGLEYFERKNWELKELNNRALRELDRVVKVNGVLEETIRKLNEENSQLRAEVDEYKIQLDLQQAENSKLRDQAMTQWSARVKAEELHAEDTRDAQSDAARLRRELVERAAEATTLRDQLSQLAQKHDALMAQKTQGSKSQGSQASSSPTTRASSEQLELLTKIGQLEATLAKLKADKDAAHDSTKRARQDVESLRARCSQQEAELGAQYKRFLTLKKNFNDLMDENDKLKTRMRVGGGRRGSNPSVALSNQTWPAQPRGGTDEVDSGAGGLRLVELKPTKQPMQPFSSGLPKAGSRRKPAGSLHKRTASESRSESLPPVPT